MQENIILRVQRESIDSEGILSQNGIRIQKSDKYYYDLANKTISIEPHYRTILKEDNFALYKAGRHNFIIMSNFSEKDIVGRRISYSANVSLKKDYDLIPAIEKEAKIYGYSLDTNDKEKIKNAIRKYKILSWSISVCIFIIIVLLIIIFLKWKQTI